MAKKQIIKKEIKKENKIPNLGQESAGIGQFSINLNSPPQKVDGIRLNIGSGVDYKSAFLNVDKYDKTADADWEIDNLPLNDNAVAQIICYSTLEHLSRDMIPKILKEWYRILKKGGDILITVPDMVNVCERFLKDPENDWALARIYGHQAHEGQFHKTGFTPKRLFRLFGCAGFGQVGIAYFDEANKVKHIFVQATK